LTKHDLSERFGNLHRGVADIKGHRMFDGFNWDDLATKKMKPCHVPSPPASSKDDLLEYGKFSECQDDQRFPPIKETKDPFLNFF